MNIALRKLLERLDAIRKAHPEIRDPDAREALATAIYHGFIVRTPGYSLPDSLGLISPEGNAAVRIALADFLDAVSNSPARTPVQRFAVFQDPTVETDEGHCYDFYFGYSQGFAEFEAARAGRTAVKPAVAKPAGVWWQFWKRSDSQAP